MQNAPRFVGHHDHQSLSHKLLLKEFLVAQAAPTIEPGDRSNDVINGRHGRKREWSGRIKHGGSVFDCEELRRHRFFETRKNQSNLIPQK